MTPATSFGPVPIAQRETPISPENSGLVSAPGLRPLLSVAPAGGVVPLSEYWFSGAKLAPRPLSVRSAPPESM
ncbi:MAG: hypothetical protein H0V81_00660 [Solirubrobacterales bacterium]|nr:hypothetical protein [Solirubrobacterales bacterium]